MSLETAKAAIGLAINDRQTPDQSLGIIFFGGEPLLRRDLIREIVWHTRELRASTGRHFHYKITTNGSLLDEEFLTDETTRDIFVALSLDGVQPAHDAHRVGASGEGTFAVL